MKVFATPKFQELLDEFPGSIQNKLAKQIDYLLKDIRHPSLRVKKYDRSKGVWQARVDRGIRFYFTIDGDTYILHKISKHPK